MQNILSLRVLFLLIVLHGHEHAVFLYHHKNEFSMLTLRCSKSEFEIVPVTEQRLVETWRKIHLVTHKRRHSENVVSEIVLIAVCLCVCARARVRERERERDGHITAERFI